MSVTSIPRMYEHDERFAAIAPRTDCNLDDEAAGRAREEFREASEKRRAEEQARIREANRANKLRLASIKSKTDDGDGLVGGGASQVSVASTTSSQMSMRLQGVRNFQERAADVYLDKAWTEHAAHRERLANARSSIDDDTEDDATGEARARLKAESEVRRRVEAETLAQANSAYFERVRAATTVTDSKIWDDGEGSAGAMRSVVAAESKARKAAEAAQLAVDNEMRRASLADVKSKIDDGDGEF